MNRPQAVSRALILFYLSLVLGLVRSWLEYDRLALLASAQGGGTAVILVQAFSFAIMIGLFLAIGWRKNWARWVLVVFMVIGLPLAIKPMIDTFANEPVSGGIGVVQWIMQLVGLVLLFSKPAREWFKKPAKPVEPIAATIGGNP